MRVFLDCPICGGEMSQVTRLGEAWVDCGEGHHRRSDPRVWNDAHVALVVKAVEEFMASLRAERLTHEDPAARS
jgi:hypothetical protein